MLVLKLKAKNIANLDRILLYKFLCQRVHVTYNIWFYVKPFWSNSKISNIGVKVTDIGHLSEVRRLNNYCWFANAC